MRLLSVAGFEAVGYSSAGELLSGDGSGAACLVTDLRLPEMSGLELLSELRARGGWPPTILITATDGPGVREEAERRGAAALLAKPFPGTVLLDRIREILSGTLPPRELSLPRPPSLDNEVNRPIIEAVFQETAPPSGRRTTTGNGETTE